MGSASLPHDCLEPPKLTPFPEVNQSCRSQWCVVLMAAEITRLNSMQLFLVGLCKRQSVQPASLQSFPELRQWITTAIASIIRDTLHKVWKKLNYHLNICYVTLRTHIESLWGVYKTFSFSISWCRCEVLSMLHLSSIPFWKWSPSVHTLYNSQDFEMW